jgi:hypothetical protein
MAKSKEPEDSAIERLGEKIQHEKSVIGDDSEINADQSQEPQPTSRLSLILLTILCPIIGLRLIASRRPDLQNKPPVRILVTAWLAIWFLGIASLIYQVTPPVVNGQTSANAVYETEQPTPEATNSVESESPTDSSPSPEPSPSQSTADYATIMAGIAIIETETVPYDRDEYQPNWNVGSGCNIRSRILTAVSTISVTFGSNGCTVIYGSWYDPYTGQVLTGNPYQGDGTANDLDIDHVIPLNYVNSHGGYYWNDSQKRAYGASLAGMDNGVYLAVSSSENRKKGDSGPASYYPPNPEYRCEYSRLWRNTARTYTIGLSSSDYNLIASVLESCGGN